MFVRGFAIVAVSLHALTTDNLTFCWTESANKSYKVLKWRLMNLPILAFRDDRKPFVVFVDAFIATV